MVNEDINLRVCEKCDAPLPCDKEKLNFFTNKENVCDDCFELLKNDIKG